MKKPITNSRVTRWFLLLQEFNITILDRIGKENTIADFLSTLQHNNEDDSIKDNFCDEYFFFSIYQNTLVCR